MFSIESNLVIVQTVSLSPSEIGATASVLLGFAPPSTLTAASSSKVQSSMIDTSSILISSVAMLSMLTNFAYSS